MKSLYAEIGGSRTVDKAVEILYRLVLDDDLLAPYFGGVDMAVQRRKFRLFMNVATGGPHKYSGVELRAAHGPAVANGMGERHVTALLGHLREALEELEVRKDLIEEVILRVGQARDHVLGR